MGSIRVSRWSIVFAILGGLVGVVLATGSMDQARAQLGGRGGPGTVGAYTYSNGSCTGNQVDPVSAVFYGFSNQPPIIHSPGVTPLSARGKLEVTQAHARHHGFWKFGGEYGGDGEKQQHFLDGSGCKPLIGDAASNTGVDLGGRYHVRLSSGGRDARWGEYQLATPHHEDTIICPKGMSHYTDPNPNRCQVIYVNDPYLGPSVAYTWRGLPVCHAIDDETKEPPGGFQRGKVNLGRHWHNWNVARGGAAGAHYAPLGPNGNNADFHPPLSWNNTEPIPQCNGNLAGNDGWVDLICIYHYGTFNEGSQCADINGG